MGVAEEFEDQTLVSPVSVDYNLMSGIYYTSHKRCRGNPELGTRNEGGIDSFAL